MADAVNIDEVLFDAAVARLPAGRVRRVESESYLNALAEEGLKVTIVLDDDTQEEELRGDVILDTIIEVNQRMQAAGDDRTPMLVFITEAELASLYDDDDDDDDDEDD